MRPFELIDPLYDAFVRSLTGSLSEGARALAVTLRLAPERGIPWSLVFSHEVTLGAPALVAEALPRIERPRVEAAVSAHMLAVIEAFGTDRIADQQVPASPELQALLQAIRDGRDASLARVGDPRLLGQEPRGGSATYEEADRTTRDAIALEASILSTRREVGFDEYEAVSLGKQAVGFPASLALASAVGADLARLRTLSDVLAGVWLGLQLADDVNDWEDDAARTGAWAIVLAGADRSQAHRDVRRAVLESGVLAKMLARSHGHFRAAEQGAESLGATRLARGAGERATEVWKLVEAERAAPGYVARRQSLGAWAAEVLP